MDIINNKDEIFEKDIETFDPITEEKILKKEKFVYRIDKNSGEKVEKKVLNIEYYTDKLTGKKIEKVMTEEDLYNNLKLNDSNENISIKQIKSNNINKIKPKNKKITVLIILLVFIIILLSIFIIGKFKEKSKVNMLEALINTINISKHDIDKVFGINQFNETIKNKNYTLNISEDITNFNIDLKLMSDFNGNKNLNLSIFNQNIINTIIDKKDIYISSRLLSNNIYKINYKDLESKINFLLDNNQFTEKEKDYLIALKTYYFNIENYSNELNKFYNEVLKYIILSLKDIDSENIYNYNKGLNGVRFYIKSKNGLEISNCIIDILNKNEKLIEYYSLLTFLLVNENYDSLEDVKEKFLQNLDNNKNNINLFFKEYKNKNSEFITIDLFENKGYITLGEISFWENFDNNKTGPKFSFIYELENINYLKNIKYTFLRYNEEIFEMMTSSQNEKDKFKFNIKMEDKYNYIGGCLEYDKINSELEIYDIDNMCFLNGKVNKFNPGKELDLELTIPFYKYKAGKVYLKFSNTSNIIKPKNNIIDVLS